MPRKSSAVLAHNFSTVGQAVANELRGRILSGEIRPRERLTLLGVGSEYKVSKNAVRDALKELEQEHLVEGRPMWGYCAAQPGGRELIGRYYVREATECMVARLCAKTMTSRQRAELEELAREADRTMPEMSGSTGPEDVEVSFHRRLAQIAGFPALTEIIVNSINYVGTFWGAQKESWGLSHVELVTEIAGGDPARAERAMRQHLTPTDEDIEDVLRRGV